MCFQVLLLCSCGHWDWQPARLCERSSTEDACPIAVLSHQTPASWPCTTCFQRSREKLHQPMHSMRDIESMISNARSYELTMPRYNGGLTPSRLGYEPTQHQWPSDYASYPKVVTTGGFSPVIDTASSATTTSTFQWNPCYDSANAGLPGTSSVLHDGSSPEQCSFPESQQSTRYPAFRACTSLQEWMDGRYEWSADESANDALTEHERAQQLLFELDCPGIGLAK